MLQVQKYDVKRDIYKNKGWQFRTNSYEEEEFKETAAHEIGHEILQAFGGTIYSWQHKGSSYYLPQDTKPKEEDEVLWDKVFSIDFMDTHGGDTKTSGEIDLMKYYNTYFNYTKKRVVAADKDVLGLLWLSKITFQ